MKPKLQTEFKKNLLKPLLLLLLLSYYQKGYSQNLLIDGNFSTSTSITPYYTDPPPLYMWLSWANYYGTGASFTTSIQTGVCSYFIDNPGTNMYDVQLTQYGFPMTLDHRFRLSFDVKADADRDFGVFIGEYGYFSGSWTNFNPSYTRHATANWQTITIDFDATAVFDLNKLSFEMGIQKINMYFANISLIDLGPIPIDKVVIAGSFESALGCSGDWLPDCENTALTYSSSTGLWTGTFSVPSGCHQYKVTINGSWDINYGENGIQGGANINLSVPSQTSITFTYDPTTHTVTTSPISSGFSTNCLPQVVLAGSFQSVLGCGSDWDPNCTNTALVYSAVTGNFENDFNIPSGYYEYRTLLNGDWNGGNFGADGVPNGSNYTIFLPCAAKVHFSYDPITHLVTPTYNANPQPNTIVIAGSFQNEVGCSGDWQADCNNTRMHYDSAYGEWFSDTLLIPAGNWEYKVTINNSWDENYGQYGIRDGDNIPMDICSPSKVVFMYYHNDCYNYHYAFAQIFPIQPNTVVIAGSFQNELNCTADWLADCDYTRMKYDTLNGQWADTLLIPAGHWEYKFTLNNSWDENYGSGGRNGTNNVLDLCYPAKVVFTFYYGNCYGSGYAQILTNGICVNKFYDANVNGYSDDSEGPMSGVSFTLAGNGITQIQTTGSDGKAAFSNMPDGIYMLKENVPPGYYTTGLDSQYIYVFSGNVVINFGNVCLGGAGAKGIGFWISKQGKAAYDNYLYKDYILQGLGTLALRNADGSNFDPQTWDEFRAWMQKANAKNMVYMLSAQLAALYLNSEIEELGNRHIYTPTIKDWNAYNGFMDVYSLVSYTNYILGQWALGGPISRDQLQSLKDLLEYVNNDADFVQLHPCNGALTYAKAKSNEEIDMPLSSADVKIWPNPSGNYFTLRPIVNGTGKTIRLKIYNISGQIVYEVNGSSNKDYRFGEKFIPGQYIAVLIQGNKLKTFKIIKQ